VRLTESRIARSEQLLVVPTEALTNRQWLLGELLSGSERRRPGWFLDMNIGLVLMVRGCHIFTRTSAAALMFNVVAPLLMLHSRAVMVLRPLQIDTSFTGHFTSLVGSVGRLKIEKN